MNKSAAEAEMDVEASRGELDRTVEALKDKMTPGQLFDEATRTMGGAGNQILSKFLDQAKENPMPLAVMGLGLAWLMTSNRRSESAAPYRGQAYGGGLYDDAAYYGSDEGSGLADKARDMASGASDAVRRATGAAADAASNAKDRIASTAERVSSGASDALRSARDASGRIAERTSAAAHRTQDKVMDLIDREPLLVGGLGLVAGLAIGASLPSTEAEKRYIGPTRDKVVDKTKELAQTGLDKVREVTEAAYHGVKDELQQGGEGQPAIDRLGKAIDAGIQAVRDQGMQPH